MPPSDGSPARKALMKNCTLWPSRGAGKDAFGTSVSVVHPSAVVWVWPWTTLGVARMNTRAPSTDLPPRAVTCTRTEIGAVRLVTRFGENLTCASTSRSPAACRLPTGSEPPGEGGGVPPPTTPVWFEIADVDPRSLRAVTRIRKVLPLSAETTL